MEFVKNEKAYDFREFDNLLPLDFIKVSVYRRGISKVR